MQSNKSTESRIPFGSLPLGAEFTWCGRLCRKRRDSGLYGTALVHQGSRDGIHGDSLLMVASDPVAPVASSTAEGWE